MENGLWLSLPVSRRSSLSSPRYTPQFRDARFKVDGLQHQPELASLVERSLLREPGMVEVSANHLTGNILVNFDSKRTLAEIASALEAAIHAARLTSSRASGHSGAQPADSKSIETPNTRHIQYAGSQTPIAVLTAAEDELIALLGSSRNGGLTTQQAAAALRHYGTNRLPALERRSRLAILLDQVTTAPIALLGVSALVSLATGAVVEVAAIASVVAVNTSVGYLTETQVERTVDALRNIKRPAAHVLRDGRLVTIPPEQVVPGDIIDLALGRFVAADARLLEAQQLTVDESGLTGESVPVVKSAVRMDAGEIALGDRVNMVYMGTAVTGGRGRAVVVGTGRNTEFGEIQALVGRSNAPPTPLQQQLGQLGRQLAIVAGVMSGGVFLVGLLRGYGFLQMLKVATSLAVAAVPEGLPAVATTTLAMGVHAMRRRHVLIRHLDAIETIGAVQVMCLDKTGTLTQNRMTVVAIGTLARALTVADDRISERDRELANPADEPDLAGLLRAAVLCNEVTVDTADPGSILNGSSTENALLRLARNAGVNIEQLRQQWPCRQINPRSEQRLLMSTLHYSGEGQQLLAVKGSPEDVLSRCGWVWAGGSRRPLTYAGRQEIETANERMARNGLRVLGLAFVEHGPDGSGPLREEDLIWLGLVGMTDPLRPGMPELIARFRAAGIKPRSALFHHGIAVGGNK
ncbi:MAG: P-type Ca2+ transporter type [Rhodospirillaceae bacterium]|nr:P-type Ca2+ transporter type [Rhodospirillaceae bacterium]